MNSNGTNDFGDFITSYPKYQKFSSNPIAQQIFDLLSDLANIQGMINYSKLDKPALAACISQIEANYGNQKIFDLTDDFTKQALGAMVRVILEPFGYDPIKQKELAKGSSVFVSSASVYAYKNSPRLSLVSELSVKKLD